MVNEILPVTAVAGADVATDADAAVRTDNDKSYVLTLHSACQNWTVHQYRTDYLTSLDARRFSAMFSDGRKKVMFNRRGIRRDTDVGTWERRENTNNSWRPGCISPIGPFGMPLVRRDRKLDYLRNLRKVLARSGNFVRMSDFELMCF